ncbi:hypothetical protein [Acidocella sp.]|uniref:hypothetical protein n=1 Tax=Acidocella sp. TaxID=50710 RepID=UPI002626E352|nr:hypothetical protein [Acidocella sp.]
MLQGSTNGAAEMADANTSRQSYLIERRVSQRMPVIKSAKIAVGPALSQGCFNCLVLDESKTGALVDLGALVVLPDEVTLHMTGGTTYRARTRWTVGSKAGLEFIGQQVVAQETLDAMQRLGRMLYTQGLPATMAALRAEGFFGNAELRKTAEAAEAAFYQLETALNLN